MQIVQKYMKDAKRLIATEDQGEIASALKFIESALAISPRLDLALELRARSLLHLRRFKEVADMLQDYIPSLRMANEHPVSVSISPSSRSSSQNILSPDLPVWYPSFKCSPVSNLKKKVMTGLGKSCEKEGEWRYLVLGIACYHLGLLEDAVVLLQTGKRLASAAFRRESVCWSDDSLSISGTPFADESADRLLQRIKSLLCRRVTALAALDSGLYLEAIRQFSKIINDPCATPQGFLAECYMHRASAHRSAGRIADSIGDCNRSLALNPTCIQALETRALLYEKIHCLSESLHDLEHLILLCNSILRDRKLPGPAWKRHNVCYREIPVKLHTLTVKSQELKQRLATRDIGNIDYYSLMGLRHGCSLWELEGAYVLLNHRHEPDRASRFIDRCELVGEHDVVSLKVKAKMSARTLYWLIHTGYTSIRGTILEEEVAGNLQ